MKVFCKASHLIILLLVSSFSFVAPLQNDVIFNKYDLYGEDNGPLVDLPNQNDSLFESIARIFGFSTQDIQIIINLTKVGLGLVDAIHKFFRDNINGTVDFSTLEVPGGEKKLLNIFYLITQRLDQIQEGVRGTQEGLRDLTRGLPHMVRWEIALNTLEDFTRGINNQFHRFTYYQKHQDQIEEHTLLNFAEHVVSHDPHSIHALMANLHSMAAPSDPPIVESITNYEREEYAVYNRVNAELSNNIRRHFVAKQKGKVNERLVRDTMAQLTLRPSIFKMLLEAVENYNDCSLKQTPQQLIFGLYTLLTIVQARGYAMSTFSYTLLKYYEEGNFTTEQRFADDLYEHYTKGMLTEALHVLKQAKNSYRRCDPKVHVEGETFEMITELLQGYVENEVDLNDDGTCRQNCGYYQHANRAGCFAPQTEFCAKERRCTGTVHNCKFFEADADICISNVTHRRYDWIAYEKGTVLGRKDECDNKLIKVDSWWRFFVHCSYCVCLCDDIKSETSDRFISLLPAVADTLENRIVTGMRFIKKNRVMHIQIQEGKALPQGQVAPQSLKWQTIEPIDVKSSAYKEGLDYFTLKYEKRRFDLDYLEAPKFHVITGLRFRKLGPHVNLEIAVTPINFTNGTLNFKLTYWISNDNTPAMAKKPRRKLKLVNPDDPRKSRYDSLVDSKSDMFVELQPTSIYSDLSQLTVPFFDAQPVAPMPPTWINAVELYHRGRPKYGGFLAFKIYNYNLTRHFDDL